ncbi:MAG: hypothetical protein IT445_08965 [Phycisphaeraceae bacterium]|nr:hypothetical protein [Phycisphaeraceae bacterium]
MRTRHIKIRWLALPVLCLILSPVVLKECRYPLSKLFAVRPSQVTLDQWAAEFEPLINAIDAYHAENGSYPPTLEAITITPPSTEYGPIQYHLEPDGSDFYLVIGDYMTDHFDYTYYSYAKEWRIDL